MVQGDNVINLADTVSGAPSGRAWRAEQQSGGQVPRNMVRKQVQAAVMRWSSGKKCASSVPRTGNIWRIMVQQVPVPRCVISGRASKTLHERPRVRCQASRRARPYLLRQAVRQCLRACQARCVVRQALASGRMRPRAASRQVVARLCCVRCVVACTGRACAGCDCQAVLWRVMVARRSQNAPCQSSRRWV
jgi:hypothetical protein